MAADREETLPLEDFLELLAGMAGYELRIARVNKGLLESYHLLPDRSPCSDPWTSELDNQRGRAELGVWYTPLPVYLQRLIAHYETHLRPAPASYRRRREEIRLALMYSLVALRTGL